MPLKISIQKSSEQVTLNIIGTKEDLADVVRGVYNRLRPTVTVSGFRPGRAPDSAIEKSLGAERVQAEVIEASVSKWYSVAIKEKNLTPLTQPHVDVVKFVPYDTLEVKIELEVVPEIKLADYKSLKVKKDPITISDKEIDEVIKGLQHRSATRNEVNRPAKLGDEVIIDFVGSQNSKAVDGAKGNDYPLLLGSKRFIPGFEEELVGLKATAIKKFDITFPKDYQVESLRNQRVTFEVTVKKVNELQEPKVDDKLASSLGPFKDVAALRTSVKQQLNQAKSDEAKNKFDNKVVSELVRLSDVKLPKKLVENEFEAMKAEFTSELKKQGKSIDQYAKDEKTTKDKWEEQLKKEAGLRIKSALVLTEVAKKEDVMVSEDELNTYIQILREQYKDEATQKQLDNPQVQKDLRNRMLTEKTIQKLVGFIKG
jgi:trigger factor